MYASVAAIEIETTGDNPRADRIGDVAAVACRNGALTSRFAAYVQPGGPVPGADARPGERPAAAVVADLFRALPGDALCLSHEAGRTTAFLQAAGAG